MAGSFNRGYLHCTILKSLHGFQEKRALKSRDMQFFLQNVPNEIFKILKMSSEQKFIRAACWINSKISNRDKNTTFMTFLFCHYCWSLLWWNYWKSLKSGSHHQKTLLYLFQWKPFKNDEKCLLFNLKNSPYSQDLCWLFVLVKNGLIIKIRLISDFMT